MENFKLKRRYPHTDFLTDLTSNNVRKVRNVDMNPFLPTQVRWVPVPYRTERYGTYLTNKIVKNCDMDGGAEMRSLR